jgi:hypothetical protein|tara:strand:+ start:217 stop:573 length:357 start_codon:yes stop_codon:yes gene_type:complete
MAKKIKTEATTNKTKKIAYIIAAILLGIILIGSIFGPSTKEAEANDSIQTGQWSAGYRYYFDMDEDQKSKLRLFGKYKQSDGDSFKIGWTRQTGKDMNQFETNIDDDGVIFFEQEFKF